MKLYNYPNGLKLKRKNKRIWLLNSNKHPNSSYLEIQTYQNVEGHFAKIQDERGIKTMIAVLSDETLELLACMIIDHLKDKRK